MLNIPHHHAVYRIVAAVLLLGNVSFVDQAEAAEDCELDTAKCGDDVSKLAKLLGVEHDKLVERLTTRSIKMGVNVIVKPLSTIDAKNNRDSMAKAMYHNLFDWLVTQMNKELYDPEDDSDDVLWIGILDVFGFECFAFNSFEQFCINFANERLQQYFNVHVVKSEQDEYTIEAIFWTPVNVPDNQDVIDLIDSKPVGLLRLLDGACNMPKADDNTFTSNLFDQWGAKGSTPMPGRLAKQRLPNNKGIKKKVEKGEKPRLFNGFSIKHFAGVITYDAEKFLEKNADAVHKDTYALLGHSDDNEVLQECMDSSSTDNQRKGKVSVGSHFSRQLETLMKNLQATDPFFIRCVNPNNQKKPGAFNPTYVLQQLRNGGLVEALRILKCGYPSRCTYEQLHSRYGKALTSLPKNMNKRDFCEAILAAFELDKQEYQLGLTKVFFRPNQGEFLEMIMKEESVTPEICALIKAHIVKKRVVRFAGFVSMYGRFHARIKSIRAMNSWFKVAGLVHRYNMHFRRRLYAMRRQKAVYAAQAVVRMVNASAKLQAHSEAAEALQVRVVKHASFFFNHYLPLFPNAHSFLILTLPHLTVPYITLHYITLPHLALPDCVAPLAPPSHDCGCNGGAPVRETRRSRAARGGGEAAKRGGRDERACEEGRRRAETHRGREGGGGGGVEEQADGAKTLRLRQRRRRHRREVDGHHTW
jgi:myosin-5